MVSTALKVTMRDIGTIHPYENNPKKHTEEAVAKLAASITEFGWTQPIAVDAEGCIILGTRRWMAATLLNQPRVPVVVCDHLDENQVKALRLADNRLADDTPVDEMLVRAELNDLVDAGFDLAATAFGPDEVHEMLRDRPERGGFLDEHGKPESVASKRMPSDVHDFVNFSVTLLPAQRDEVVRALKKVQAQRGLDTAGSALLAICQEINQA